jgi:hypothetical protein
MDGIDDLGLEPHEGFSAMGMPSGVFPGNAIPDGLLKTRNDMCVSASVPMSEGDVDYLLFQLHTVDVRDQCIEVKNERSRFQDIVFPFVPLSLATDEDSVEAIVKAAATTRKHAEEDNFKNFRKHKPRGGIHDVPTVKSFLMAEDNDKFMRLTPLPSKLYLTGQLPSGEKIGITTSYSPNCYVRLDWKHGRDLDTPLTHAAYTDILQSVCKEDLRVPSTSINFVVKL